MDINDLLCGPPPESIALFRLPPELLASIYSHLTNTDIGNLRLTCSTASFIVRLRFSRVFLSPNPVNLRVFCAVADHPTIRLQIQEIIYDDARLGDFKNWKHYIHEYPDEGDADAEELVSDDDADAGYSFESRFRAARNANKEILRDRNAGDEPTLPQHVYQKRMASEELPWEVVLDTYCSLVSEQNEMIATGADIHVLKYGLTRFPALRRITVTPATHGYLYTPLYRTPMIRLLPDGFNYPLPRGWPTTRVGPPNPLTPAIGASDGQVAANHWDWRGLLSVLQTVADSLRHGNIPSLLELVIDVHGLDTGVNPHMFAQDGPDYDNWAAILRQPGFSRLDLPLMVGGLMRDGWGSLTNGYFRSLLAEAADLEHFYLRSDEKMGAVAWMPKTATTRYMPLCSILPLDQWKRLRHFGLSNLQVQSKDVVSALAALPSTLQSVELSFLQFVETPEDSIQNLLYEMNARLEWKNRDPAARPKAVVGLLYGPVDLPARGIWFSEEVSEFLYHGGQNPIQWGNNLVPVGVGVVKDEFDPAYERPNADHDTLIKLGFYPEDELMRRSS
ncbi:hypothetical protein QQS21_012401 [Conoideocrella luteorostrata]|uniref:F-box domain-containing protein n=1 Tax=Conoideocrella luteorostrata TaxID=1105319 RepID=A0AAJ0CBJ4_9HYPO|nr:hypothetical protein QQS21_012401 [Conoideocrella luteorostrata]